LGHNQGTNRFWINCGIRKYLILKRRDVRVVEGARLESDALDVCLDVPKHLFRRAFNDLAPERCLSVFPRK
jgi:hypothetical protein